MFHTFPTAQYLIPTDSQGLHQSVSHISYSTTLNTNWQSRIASKCFTHFLQHNSQYQLTVMDCIKMFHTSPTAQYLIPTDGQGLHQSVSHTSYSTILNTNWWSRLLQCKGLTDLGHDQAKNKLANSHKLRLKEIVAAPVGVNTRSLQQYQAAPGSVWSTSTSLFCWPTIIINMCLCPVASTSRTARQPVDNSNFFPPPARSSQNTTGTSQR